MCPIFCKSLTSISFYYFILPQGFYKGYISILSQDLALWKSALNDPLHLKVDYQMTAKSHVLDTSLLGVHFILSLISPNGNPARFICETMAAYLTVNTFRYQEVEFNFIEDRQVDLHAIQMAKFVQDIQK